MNVVLNARNRGTHTPKWAICTVEHPAASLDACDRDHRPSSTRYLPMLAMLTIAVLLTHFLSVSFTLSLCLSPQFPTRSYNLLYSLYSAIFGVIFYWLCDYFKVVIHIVAFLQAKKKTKNVKNEQKNKTNKTKYNTEIKVCTGFNFNFLLLPKLLCECIS